MRTFKLFVIGLALLMSKAVSAQVSVNVNIGSPPLWGPVGYTDIRYYYLPDIEAYYDINSSMFIYYGGGTWIHTIYLPTQYSSYDLYYGYKVVINNYYGDAPYVHFNDHKVKYKKGYRGKAQKTIGNAPGKGNSNQKERSGNENKGQRNSNKEVNKSKEKSPEQNSPKSSNGPTQGKKEQGQKSGPKGGGKKK
jgi:hypothetical protein